MASDFVGKLRLNNLFPPGEGLYDDRPPIGMPDFEYGEGRYAGMDKQSQSTGGSRRTTGGNRPTTQRMPQQRGPSRIEQIMNPPKMDVVLGKDSYIGGAGSRIMERSDQRSAARNDPTFEQEKELVQLKEGGRAEDRAIKQQRANVYEFKAKNPNMRILTPKGGNITAVNPQTGETVDLGVPTGTLGDRELYDIRNQNALGQIEARGEQTRETQEMRGGQQLEQIGARIRGQQDVKGTPSYSNLQEELPTQVKVRQQNAVRELMTTRPELAEFITQNADGTFEVTPPGEGFFGGATGPTPEQLQEINNIVFADRPAPIVPTNVAPQVGGDVMEKTQRNKSTGETRVVVSADGGQTWTPKQ